jgi:hypothetical protein
MVRYHRLGRAVIKRKLSTQQVGLDIGVGMQVDGDDARRAHETRAEVDPQVMPAGEACVLCTSALALCLCS